MSETIVQERVSRRFIWTLAALSAAAKLDRVAMGMLRAGLVIVLVWIGGLKFVDYEAEGIVPLVANSPLMNFLYHRPAEYRTHMNKEGELNPEHRAWHRENGTYTFSHGLGVVIVSIGLLIAIYPVNPTLSALGNLRVIPVFGKGALTVSPRVGHIHITVDDAPWHFVDASGETIILVGLIPGPHKVLIELADPTHRVISSETVEFVVPKPVHPSSDGK